MPLKTELKSIILQEIEQVFGRRIVSSRDCIDLSEDIFRKTKYQINPNTLRRFFAIIKAEYPASQSTLIILAKYCGFQSLEDIHHIKKHEAAASGTIDAESMLHYLVSMFGDTFVKDPYDETFLNLVIHSIQFLNSYKFLTDKFQNLVAKTKNGVNFYFEQLVHVDKLNSYYGAGLRYYLREKATVEAEMYTASLFTFRYWLNGDNEKLENSAEMMLGCRITNTTVPHFQARQLAGQLYYYQAMGVDTENLRITISHFLTDLNSSPGRKEYIYQCGYILCEALLLTGFSGDTLFYIRQFPRPASSHAQESNTLSLIQNFNLLEAYALWESGETRLAERKFADIRSSEFSFLSKKFAGIIYMSLLQKMKPKDKKREEQFHALIEETGFERLYNLLPVNKFGKML